LLSRKSPQLTRKTWQQPLLWKFTIQVLSNDSVLKSKLSQSLITHSLLNYTNFLNESSLKGCSQTSINTFSQYFFGMINNVPYDFISGLYSDSLRHTTVLLRYFNTANEASTVEWVNYTSPHRIQFRKLLNQGFCWKGSEFFS
jgi:hypothetical protein